MVVVCARADPTNDREAHAIYVWMGLEFEEKHEHEKKEIEGYIEAVKKKYWGKDKKGHEVDASSLQIVRFNEEPGEETDEFNNFFD